MALIYKFYVIIYSVYFIIDKFEVSQSAHDVGFPVHQVRSPGRRIDVGSGGEVLLWKLGKTHVTYRLPIFTRFGQN